LLSADVVDRYSDEKETSINMSVTRLAGEVDAAVAGTEVRFNDALNTDESAGQTVHSDVFSRPIITARFSATSFRLCG